MVLVPVVMVALSASRPTRPTDCLVSLPPLSSQNIQSHEPLPSSHRAWGEIQTMTIALGANRESKETVKDKASLIQISQVGSSFVYVRRNAQHPGLKLPDSTRFVRITVAVVAVSTSGPTGCPVSHPPLIVETFMPT